VDNRRVLIAVLLSIVVIVGWQLLFPPPKPPEPPPEKPAAEAPAEGAPGAAEKATEKGASEAGEAAPAAAPATETEEGAEPPAEAIAAEREERITLSSDTFEAELSNRGAQLVSLKLPQYMGPKDKPVDLVRDRQGDLYPFGLVDEAGKELAVDAALFTVDHVSGRDGLPAVRFRYSGPEGSVTKVFTVLPKGLLGVSIEARGVGKWGTVLGPGLRNPSARDEERRFKYRGSVYLSGDDIETVRSDKVEKTRVVSGTGLHWIGLEDTYFLSALIPETPVAQAVIEPFVVDSSKEGLPKIAPLPPEGVEGADSLRHELRVAVYPEGEQLDGEVYLGAKDLERLGALPWRLSETVRLGMFGFFSKGLLEGLKWIYQHVVPNYGWAIVLMTILIKVVLLPLTHKSYMSMQKMQEVAPRIKSIRAKYKGKLRDKKGRPDIEQQRKMNEEIQALYKSEGVNPAGGCLPMLIQFPVLIAFYRLLENAVELRDAPWTLWIHDLSMHDPIYVLPIVMGATQFLQQRLAPSSAEPMQRRMMMAMPVVFTFLFLGFPSGLVLYWLTNNVLTVIQQWIYHRTRAKQAAAA